MRIIIISIKILIFINVIIYFFIYESVTWFHTTIIIQLNRNMRLRDVILLRRWWGVMKIKNILAYLCTICLQRRKEKFLKYGGGIFKTPYIIWKLF